MIQTNSTPGEWHCRQTTPGRKESVLRIRVVHGAWCLFQPILRTHLRGKVALGREGFLEKASAFPVPVALHFGGSYAKNLRQIWGALKECVLI